MEGKWNEIVAKFSRKKVNLAKRGLEEDPRAYGGSPEAKVHVCEGASSSSATLPLAKKRKVEAEAAARCRRWWRRWCAGHCREWWRRRRASEWTTSE